MDARILQACDAAVALILSGWTGKGPKDGVQQDFAPRINLTADATPTHEGRQIYVFPVTYGATLLTRNDQWRDYKFSTVMVEQFTDDAGPPPKTWIRERVNWFEKYVFNVLANQQLVLLDEMSPALDDQATIDTLWDQPVLQQHRTFWCQATFPWAEDTDTTGGVSP